MIIAIEGIDGAGKNTLTTQLHDQLTAAGKTVTRLGFPNYGATLFADLADDALHGRLGDTADSAWAMALLFALDRRDSSGALASAVDSHDVVLLDRYVASNVAYTLARTMDSTIIGWLEELEFGRFELPRPQLTVYLEAPVELAAQRAAGREVADAARTRDRYERDADLQSRTAAAYRQLADAQFGGPWIKVAAQESTADSARKVLAAVAEMNR
ncbi:dTMP kinase [Corynebacterium sp. TAE3-ERU12]|nr:dTMP kinase [Corynebacterium sp. TAE3-ERU12]MBV7294815.1 dTMP kinase [Corynebacterium sp. TAE3-ERU12]